VGFNWLAKIGVFMFRVMTSSRLVDYYGLEKLARSLREIGLVVEVSIGGQRALV
jgi:hypothetical protein